jgi:hypothetical protein
MLRSGVPERVIRRYSPLMTTRPSFTLAPRMNAFKVPVSVSVPRVWRKSPTPTPP